MSEITGLNPTLAKQQIDDFYQTATEIGNDFHMNRLLPFFENVGKVWYSPKAVEFWNVHFYDLLLAVETYNDAVHNVCVKATAAYNRLATSNGLPGIGETDFGEEVNSRALWAEGSLGLTEAGIYFQEASPDGIVGMDYQKVNDYVDRLKEDVRVFVDKVEALPVTIAFFDPDGSLQELYKGLIRAGVADVVKSVITMSSGIKSATQEEINAVVAAKESAASTLGGN